MTLSNKSEDVARPNQSRNLQEEYDGLLQDYYSAYMNFIIVSKACKDAQKKLNPHNKCTIK